MNENTKLYVFARKEVALISIFVILMVATAFIFGIKIGKHYSFESAGLIQEDRDKVELLSKEEEMVEKLVGEGTEKKEEKSPKALSEDAFKRLKSKIDSEFSDTPQEEKREAPKAQEMPTTSSKKAMEQEQNVVEDTNEKVAKRDELSGKYSIQLGSYRTLKEAQQFADAFKVRGYDPIINEVSIEGRGVWFRVSIGVFNSTAEAREFINKEESLFSGQDYVISEFD